MRRQQVLGSHRGLGARLFRSGRIKKNSALGLYVGVVDVDFHQEAIELRLGQWVRAFLLERVLRRQHVERLGQIVARACNRHVLFLHRLQEC